MTTSLSLAFEPHLPWAVIAALALLSAALLAYGFVRRARGTFLRLLFAALLLLALANPVLRREERAPLDDVVVLALDRSPSMRLPGRTERLEETAAALRERLAELGRVELKEIELPGGPDGTRLLAPLDEALGRVDRARLGAVLVVTDGVIHDAPRDPEHARAIGAPVHALLVGRPDEVDRRLVVEQAPTFAMVGEPQRLTVGFDDLPGGTGEAARITVRRDGRVLAELEARAGERASVPFTLDRAGRSVLEVEVAAREGELTTLNNRTAVTINGVRDRLRVLLVSGQPYPGLRVWRNLLKADAAVDLVHFTILRPPEKQDGTPIRELALIAFPSRELFELKLHEFDLVIFDRYNRRGLLPLPYLENVARYVERGGALLEAAGPEFATPTGLYRTPLARVLPGRPSGEVVERPFLPRLTEVGRRHPVTSGLAADPAEPGWGRWLRQIDVDPGDATVVMSGAADRPLLLLKRVGEGRVAQLLSDHHWLWQRGFEGGGPQAQLLRRLVHWLMKEPELEEETLTAQPHEEGIEVVRRSLAPQPVEVTLTSPSGAQRKATLVPDADGIARLRVPAEEDGLWRVEDGTRVAHVVPRPIAAAELAELRASAERLRPLVEATGGASLWLGQEGVPELRRVAADRRAAGRGWLGIVANEAYTVTGASRTDLLPPWLALLLLTGAAAAAWWREGRA
ncbi:MAG: membrane protein [Geminicoccaceae bacterium]|nr:MAG: membrane protein [Geminicoccaceae bacterium]